MKSAPAPLHPSARGREDPRGTSVCVYITGPLARRTLPRHRWDVAAKQMSVLLSVSFLSDDCGSTSPAANTEAVCDAKLLNIPSPV